MIAASEFGEPSGGNFSDAMSVTMGKSGLIASLFKPIAEGLG